MLENSRVLLDGSESETDLVDNQENRELNSEAMDTESKFSCESSLPSPPYTPITKYDEKNDSDIVNNNSSQNTKIAFETPFKKRV